jgi:hypothetical protein
LQIAAKHGARHAELVGDLFLNESGEVLVIRVIRVIRGSVFGDLLLGESAEVQLHRPTSPVSQRLASP